MEISDEKYQKQPQKKIVFPDGSMIIEIDGGAIIVEAQAEYWTSPVLRMRYCSISRN